jgi:hypothetical protein
MVEFLTPNKIVHTASKGPICVGVELRDTH